jgi:nitrogen regulatory protein P-II 2
MRLIAATIRVRDWERVRAALARLGVHDIDLTLVQLLAPDNGRVQLYAGAEYIADRVPQARIEMAVDAGQVDGVIAAIDRCAHDAVCPCSSIIRERRNLR